jgi:sulfur carrier protein ThiS
MLAELTGKVRLIRVNNPFDARDRDDFEMDWAHDKPLSDYFSEIGSDWIVSVSGRIVEREDMDRTFVNSDDVIVVCPVPQGGAAAAKEFFAWSPCLPWLSLRGLRLR